MQKSNLIEPNAVLLKKKNNCTDKICPYCKIPLVKRRGSYGEFWGCQNYPKCRYIQKASCCGQLNKNENLQVI